ncbi:Helix-loop-helix protein 6 [Caenorhabditis elegans]|uniref:Helix-loop-helix protein 6 n=1 Tax=Caenorhabditis elegans TaxID=6239 RepID=HLH6_CAEEL|nr:Helix-loop-helix protein 6 [Caenorhabditis elegans]Q10007.1 RecName: Full=Helix-loop-helix protein 6 [Caenorhabditis elegans]CAA87416.1 Helix-loop-helix protein 6 [Caenorhabditis elegans]|eukprot:NP_496070.1 Helix-loop-helix protein 6 [Caenorhabditis elegans]
MSISQNNFLTMFPVTYTFENGVYSTIINQNTIQTPIPNPIQHHIQNHIQTSIPNTNLLLENVQTDVQKLMVPLIDQQFHIPTSTPLQLAPIPTQIQSQLQPQISQIPIHNQPQIQIQSQVQPQLPTQSQPKPSSKASLDTSSNAFKKYVNPFAPEATVPLPVELEDQYGPYSSSVWKRNERERCRVRNVNDGYERLRKHLPVHFDEKRISKVDTLRLAIRYIKHLDNLLRSELHQYNCKCFNGFQEESEGNILIDISTFNFNSSNNAM